MHIAAGMHECMWTCKQVSMHWCNSMHAWLHACMAACQNGCVHVSIYACTSPCTHARMGEDLHACLMYAWMPMRVPLWLHACHCIPRHQDGCIHISMYACTRPCMHASMAKCSHACKTRKARTKRMCLNHGIVFGTHEHRYRHCWLFNIYTRAYCEFHHACLCLYVCIHSSK